MQTTSFKNRESDTMHFQNWYKVVQMLPYICNYAVCIGCDQRKSFFLQHGDRVGCPVTMVASSLEGWSREVTRGGELLLGHVTPAGWLDVFWQAVRGSRSKATNLWQRQALWWSVSSKRLLAGFVVSIERDLDKFGYLTSSEVSRLASFGRQSHSVG